MYMFVLEESTYTLADQTAFSQNQQLDSPFFFHFSQNMNIQASFTRSILVTAKPKGVAFY